MKVTVEIAQKRLDERNSGIVIDQLTWVNTQLPCRFSCINGHSWTVKATKVINEGSGCRICFKENKRIWTEETITEAASRYASKGELQDKEPNVYCAAYRHFPALLESLFPHRLGRSKREILYIWQVVGTDIYKIGITGSSRGKDRIREVASAAQVKSKLVLYANLKTFALARKFERKIKEKGLPVTINRLSGFTEFRVFTEEEITNIIAEVQLLTSLDD